MHRAKCVLHEAFEGRRHRCRQGLDRSWSLPAGIGCSRARTHPLRDAAATASATTSPAEAGTKVTSKPPSSARRSATGFRLNAGSSPLGRPRWLQTAAIAPVERIRSIVGSAIRIRKSSPTVPSSNGTLRSDRTRTLDPSRSRSSSVNTSATVRLSSSSFRPYRRYTPPRSPLRPRVPSQRGWCQSLFVPPRGHRRAPASHGGFGRVVVRAVRRVLTRIPPAFAGRTPSPRNGGTNNENSLTHRGRSWPGRCPA